MIIEEDVGGKNREKKGGDFLQSTYHK